jgi:4'-phosphopantetheinyl transferase EntD
MSPLGQVPELLAWRRLLPEWVSVSAGALPAAPPDVRRQEFTEGRRHARLALGALGLSAVEIPVAHDRRPVWPIGVVGSLTHARDRRNPLRPGHVVAAVAASSRCHGLGVDAEYIGALAPELWPRVLTAAELAQVLTLRPSERPARVHALWCAKEAAMKAWRRVFDPLEVGIALSGDASVLDFQARPSCASERLPAAEGRMMHTAGLAAAMVVLP